jgi:hypothetical protein
MTPTEIHNRDVGLLIKAVIKPTLEAGGSFFDVLVLLESIVVGVIMFGIKAGGDEHVLDVLVERIKERLAEQRLKDTDPKGTA